MSSWMDRLNIKNKRGQSPKMRLNFGTRSLASVTETVLLRNACAAETGRGPSVVPSVPWRPWVCILVGQGLEALPSSHIFRVSTLLWLREHVYLGWLDGALGEPKIPPCPKTPLGWQMPKGNSECSILASIMTFFFSIINCAQ